MKRLDNWLYDHARWYRRFVVIPRVRRTLR